MLTMTPDASKHDPRPTYIRELIARAGLSQREAAARIGVSARMMRYYVSLNAKARYECPYVVQYALESIEQKIV